jgi:hypothetical protein
MYSATMKDHPGVVCEKWGAKARGMWRAVAFPASLKLSVAVGEQARVLSV